MLGLIGGITGIVSFIISLSFNIYGVFQNRFQALSEYYSMDRDVEFVKARRKIYNLEENQISEDASVSMLISMFHFYGLMVKKHRLPFYIFKSASGLAVVKMYDKLKPTISMRRKDNKYYAEYFEWLYNKVKKYNKL